MIATMVFPAGPYIKLNRIPKKGYKYDIMLHFKKAGMVKVNAEVKDGPPNAKGMTHIHG